jgi:hypothetical protein
MSNRIEILDNNTVEIFAEGSNVPFLRQPHWPNETPWADAEEARAWAEMYVESVEVAEAPFAPGGPGLDRLAKPTPKEFVELPGMINPFPPK